MSGIILKWVLKTIGVLLLLYAAVCVLVYFIQERLLFFPERLPAGYMFHFPEPFEERTIPTGDGAQLNALLFKSGGSKGLIFYLHGNAGSLRSWGEVAGTYTQLGYDVLIFDYRGYGKSTGKIHSEQQFYADAQIVYDSIKTSYGENKIIILGYSVGTGTAAKLAADNHPRQLILQAPYFSMKDMARYYYPVLPSFLLKYTFPTYRNIQRTAVPVTIFHGNVDEVIYYGSSEKLKAYFKPGDTLITLKGQGHNGMTDNPEYREVLRRVLE
ncbi:alpha/beta hydrolase [Chitinophaga sp.]|uniref:alpha/beta hydrolase n=1 Tax=Chitinophaga sp. TaxID=1869181 RepID=UPI002C2D10BD|nr:alpha/beta fold hydrolase [Chitinophaga sp.]HWV68354.1 alpha/beta fold hydrolase [Chitinophaga sp.]